MEKKDFKTFLGSKGGKIAMVVLFYAIIFPTMLCVSNLLSETVALILGIVFGVFGWKALGRIQPDIFLIMPIGGWLLYFVIKGVLSVIIGVFVAPFVLANKISTAIQSTIS